MSGYKRIRPQSAVSKESAVQHHDKDMSVNPLAGGSGSNLAKQDHVFTRIECTIARTESARGHTESLQAQSGQLHFQLPIYSRPTGVVETRVSMGRGQLLKQGLMGPHSVMAACKMQF